MLQKGKYTLIFFICLEIMVKQDTDECKQQSSELSQKVFQRALRRCSVAKSSPNVAKSTPNTPFMTHTNEFAGLLSPSTHSTDTNAISKANPKISRIMSENNIVRSVTKKTQSAETQPIELRRLYYKKNEVSNTEVKVVDKNTPGRKYSFGYSTNELLRSDRPLLSQKSYETLSKSQANLFRFTAV